MANEKNEKSIIQQATDVFQKLADVKSKPDEDPFVGKHLNVVILGMWADGKFPENFLGMYLIDNIEHVMQCEKCRQNVLFYKARRR